MKKRIFLCIIAWILLLSASLAFAETAVSTQPTEIERLAGIKIGIDPGHQATREPRAGARDCAEFQEDEGQGCVRHAGREDTRSRMSGKPGRIAQIARRA